MKLLTLLALLGVTIAEEEAHGADAGDEHGGAEVEWFWRAQDAEAADAVAA